ncbi:MAG: putative metal-dependent phosphoesterase TrpH [Myxococcota bacterium]|jgi:predicted metal-dependent phosphoesterase TrpH
MKKARELRLDLHMHSTRSDGKLSPEEVLRQCAVSGLDVIALTDHDMPPALPWGMQTVAGRGIRVLHGVELSTTHEDTEQHLLVYFPREMPAGFAEFCKQLVIARADRYDEAVRRINLPGLELADAAARRGEHALTRTHLSMALVEAGHAATLQEAFDRWAGSKPGLVPHVRLSFLTAIRHAVAAGGVTSWAHPNLRQAREWVKEAASAGLHALEVYRPRMGKTRQDGLIRLAARNRLALTGGSDYHGWSHGQLGSFSVSGRRVRDWGRRLSLDV